MCNFAENKNVTSQHLWLGSECSIYPYWNCKVILIKSHLQMKKLTPKHEWISFVISGTNFGLCSSSGNILWKIYQDWLNYPVYKHV